MKLFVKLKPLFLPFSFQAYRLWAKKMLAANVPLHRLGVQSHFDYEIPPDPTMMKVRFCPLIQKFLSTIGNTSSGICMVICNFTRIEIHIHKEH